MNWVNLFSPPQLHGFVNNSISSAGILILAVVFRAALVRSIRLAFKNVKNRSPVNVEVLEIRAKTLRSIVYSIISLVVFIIAGLMILSEWGVNITPFLTGAGILGLAIGMGTQTVVRDAMTGFFILLENQFNVGDKVRVAGFEGEVMEMNVRTTVIKTNEGDSVILPNSRISDITRLKG
ncbi:mechanosensitive ion channel family protein [Patescibacteria group bacterium]|nr:mechanosensitive ion channel family protein [Patescibacteria group bacterium]MBU1868316.1 mechanosensitive ion channel family protein [Patescibacteria group bacterium]